MQRILNAWKRSAHSGPASLEIYLAGFSLLWAVMLLLPTMQHTNIANVMDNYVPLPVWSLGLFVLGIYEMWAVPGSYRRRRAAAWVGGCVWSALAMLLFVFALEAHLSVLAALTSSLQFVSMAAGYTVALLSLTLIWPEHKSGH
jgi:hypothetical protein